MLMLQLYAAKEKKSQNEHSKLFARFVIILRNERVEWKNPYQP